MHVNLKLTMLHEIQYSINHTDKVHCTCIYYLASVYGRTDNNEKLRRNREIFTA